MCILKRLKRQAGFTMVEIIMACFILAFVAVGVWGVYWSVMSTYYQEQRGALIEAEGERVLDLIANGGYVNGKRVYGLTSHVPRAGYPVYGAGYSTNFWSVDYALDEDMGCSDPQTEDHHRDDYRIEFCLDDESAANPRFAEFAVQLYQCDDENDGSFQPDELFSTAILWFRITDGTANPECNYEVEITENLLLRAEGNVDGDESWNKAVLLPNDPSSDYCSGAKVSFYLANMDYPVRYDADLNRELTITISDPAQERSFAGGIPYPHYFSRSIYFPIRK